jgi:hypothetical protein
MDQGWFCPTSGIAQITYSSYLSENCLDKSYYHLVLVMGTGNPGVFPGIPVPLPVETHTLAVGTGFLMGPQNLTHGSGGYRPAALPTGIDSKL